MYTGRRKNLGDLHADTLQSINNLGMLKHAGGDDDTAETLLREALEGRKQTVTYFSTYHSCVGGGGGVFVCVTIPMYLYSLFICAFEVLCLNLFHPDSNNHLTESLYYYLSLMPLLQTIFFLKNQKIKN
jgi:hypothetical protein